MASDPGAATEHKWLLHVDLDQFQVSVERARKPELIGAPVIVGGNGDPTEARKVVTCASYEARAAGVHAGMPLRSAYRKMPEAIWLPTDFSAYDEWSGKVMDTLRGLGHPVEVWGWDEAFVGADVDDPLALARELRAAVLASPGLPCAVGISDNKQRTKMATGFAKSRADERYFLLDEGNWAALMGQRPCIDLWGVGARTAAKLTRLGIRTVDELAAASQQDLTAAFGPHQGGWLYVLARGWGDRSITTKPAPAKSHSKVETFPEDLRDREQMRRELSRLSAELLEQVISEGRVVFRVAVTVRTASFWTRTKSHKLSSPTTDLEVLEREVLALLDAFELDRPVRLLGPRFDLVDID